MTTTVQPLDPDVRSFMESLIRSRYLDISCFELAIALHRGLDWDLVGLLDASGAVRHAAVRCPEGGFLDARGRVAYGDFATPFGAGEIISFTMEHELKHRTRLIVERDIISAGTLAMSLWPDLPWLKDTHFQKMLNFLDELEMLSRAHGFWLHNDSPMAWAIIRSGNGEEEGYTLAINGVGSYTFNRVLTPKAYVMFPGSESE